MPRLPWRRSETGGYIAFPNGEENRLQFAYISAEMMSRPMDGARWPYGVSWEGRFSYNGVGAPTKQEAADQATLAWWLELERTEGWVEPPPAPPPPPPDPRLVMLAEHRERQLKLMQAMEPGEFCDHYFAYRDAASGDGPSIDGDPDMDMESWRAAQGAYVQRWGHGSADYQFRNIRRIVLNVGGKTLLVGCRASVEVIVNSFHPAEGWVQYGISGFHQVRGPLALFEGQQLVQGARYRLVGRVTGIEHGLAWGSGVVLDGIGALPMPIPWQRVSIIDDEI